MMAQAEHDEMAQSIVISPDKAHLQAVKESLTRLLPNTPRANIIRRSLEVRGALILAHNLTDCCRIADDIAAEHVQVMCANAQEIADNIRNAGGIFIGKHSCAPLGDYCAGLIMSCRQPARRGCFLLWDGRFLQTHGHFRGRRPRRRTLGQYRNTNRRSGGITRPRTSGTVEIEIKLQIHSPMSANWALAATARISGATGKTA